jgi:hypothetical protein
MSSLDQLLDQNESALYTELGARHRAIECDPELGCEFEIPAHARPEIMGAPDALCAFGRKNFDQIYLRAYSLICRSGIGNTKERKHFIAALGKGRRPLLLPWLLFSWRFRPMAKRSHRAAMTAAFGYGMRSRTTRLFPPLRHASKTGKPNRWDWTQFYLKVSLLLAFGPAFALSRGRGRQLDSGGVAAMKKGNTRVNLGRGGSVVRRVPAPRAVSFIGKEFQDLTHHAFSLIGLEQGLRVG